MYENHPWLTVAGHAWQMRMQRQPTLRMFAKRC